MLLSCGKCSVRFKTKRSLDKHTHLNSCYVTYSNHSEGISMMSASESPVPTSGPSPSEPDWTGESGSDAEGVENDSEPDEPQIPPTNIPQ